MSKDISTYRCEGCAFNAGTDANRSAITRLKAKLCLDAGEPFYCHEPVQEATKGGMPLSVALEQVEQPLCAGWLEAMTVKMEAGYYEKLEDWRLAVMRGCLQYIAKVEAGAARDLDDDMPDELRACIEQELSVLA